MCQQPREVGPCKAHKPRFYFDQIEGTCRQFNYGGCQANDNNFATHEDCYNRCGGQPPQRGGVEPYQPSGKYLQNNLTALTGTENTGIDV